MLQICDKKSISDIFLTITSFWVILGPFLAIFGHDEYEEPEVDGAYQGPVDQEEHITLLSDEVKSDRCFFFKVLIISVR